MAHRSESTDLKQSLSCRRKKANKITEEGIRKEKKKKKKKNIRRPLDPIKENHLCVTLEDSTDQVDEEKVNEMASKSTTETNEQDPEEDWFSPLHHLDGNNIAKKLKVLEAKGITPVKGPWSTKEINRLHDNMMNYLRSNEVKDFKRLIIPATLEDRKFRIDTRFVYKMCKGIRRTYSSITARVTHQYSHFLKKGTYSSEEKKELFHLRAMGKKWKEIGLIMNRMHLDMPNRHDCYHEGWNRGPWTKEEKQLLQKAVAEFGIAADNNKKGTWKDVSKYVGTRSYMNCLNRWRRMVTLKEDVGEEILFTDNDALKLVSTIYQSGLEDEYLIEWNSLSEMFDGSVTPKWLRWKWGVLIKEVPHSQYLEFPDVVEKLHALYESKGQNDTDATNGDSCSSGDILEKNAIIVDD